MMLKITKVKGQNKQEIGARFLQSTVESRFPELPGEMKVASRGRFEKSAVKLQKNNIKGQQNLARETGPRMYCNKIGLISYPYTEFLVRLCRT